MAKNFLIQLPLVRIVAIRQKQLNMERNLEKVLKKG